MNENKFSLVAGVTIPILQAVISGILAFILAGLVSFIVWHRLRLFTGVLGVLVASGVWFSYLKRWNYVAGLVPYPEPDPLPLREVAREEPERVQIELLENNGNTGQYLSLPARYEQLVALSRGVLSGAGLGVNSWCGDGRPFSRAEFEALRAELLRRGLLAWNNERARGQGVRLTPQGRAVLRYFSTPPQGPE